MNILKWIYGFNFDHCITFNVFLHICRFKLKYVNNHNAFTVIGYHILKAEFPLYALYQRNIIRNKVTHHTINRQQLVTSLQSPVSVGHSTRDNTGDVDGRVLLLASHHIEAQALLCLGKLYHSGMGMALAGCESCYCCLSF